MTPITRLHKSGFLVAGVLASFLVPGAILIVFIVGLMQWRRDIALFVKDVWENGFPDFNGGKTWYQPPTD